MIAELAVEEQDRLWTPQETANALRVSKSWVYRAHQTGQLPGGVKLGHSTLRFVPELVAEYVMQLAQGSD